jgi:hypothetical protein
MVIEGNSALTVLGHICAVGFGVPFILLMEKRNLKALGKSSINWRSSSILFPLGLSHLCTVANDKQNSKKHKDENIYRSHKSRSRTSLSRNF